jgi:hypothetical protein
LHVARLFARTLAGVARSISSATALKTSRGTVPYVL